MKDVNVDEFFKLVDVKNNMPIGDLDSDIDKTEAEALIMAFNQKIRV